MASSEFEAFYRDFVLEGNRQPDLPLSARELREGVETMLADYFPEPDIAFESMALENYSLLLCRAPEIEDNRAILFFHGGGYNAGSNFSHRDLMGRLSRASRAVVIGVDYRLAPENPFPVALEDAIASYEFVQDELGFSQVMLGGLSAGGGLALSLLLALKKKKKPLPLGAICFCPWVDLALKAKSLVTHDGQDMIRKTLLKTSADDYCGDRERTDPLISPLYGDLSGLPPLFIQVGAREILLDEIVELAKKAKSQHVPTQLSIWPEMVHGWHLFSKKLPEGRQAVQEAGLWAEKRFGSIK